MKNFNKFAHYDCDVMEIFITVIANSDFVLWLNYSSII